MVDTTKASERLSAIGIEANTIQNILKNQKLCAKFMEVLDIAGVSSCNKEKGALFYAVASKVKPVLQPFLREFVLMVAEDKWQRVSQLDEGIKFVDTLVKTEGTGAKINQAEWEKASGVGIVVTKEMIEEAVTKLFNENEAAIKEQGHAFNFAKFLNSMKEIHKWADGGVVRATVEAKKLEVLGEAPADGKKVKVKKEAPAGKDKEEEEPTIDITKIIGRDVDAGNTPELLAKHREFTKGRIMTRFPPEPNGYLHIGHAKAIRFNFTLAKIYGGETYLRFDDTNPCKENNEFIDHIKEIVGWLGFKPWKVTASSDYFQEMYELAIKLIKKGKAYVCFQNKEQMAQCRNDMIDSPWRNTSVEENLALF